MESTTEQIEIKKKNKLSLIVDIDGVIIKSKKVIPHAK